MAAASGFLDNDLSTAHSFNADAIPTELKAFPQWVCWRREERDGKPTKVPYNARTGARASATDASTWSTFAEAVAAAPRHNGIGFVFSDADPFCGIDLDNCIDEDGEQSDVAEEILATLDGYSETSVGGRGIHIIVRGRKPAGACRNTKLGLEMYDRGRFFCMTGKGAMGFTS